MGAFFHTTVPLPKYPCLNIQALKHLFWRTLCKKPSITSSLVFTATKPVLVNVMDSLKGLQTIRAFKCQELFIETFDAHLNQLTWANFLGVCIRCCMSFYSAFTLVVYSSIVIYLSIFLTESEQTVFFFALLAGFD